MRTIPIGSWEIVREGRDVALLAVGTMVRAAAAAADLLHGWGIAAGVVNCRFVKPLDETMLCDLAGRHRMLVTLEENALRGGFGSAVYERLSERGEPVPRLMHFGIPDRFIEHGSRETLLGELGLQPPQIAEKIRSALASMRSAE
jgi:1-deoxy-D-xylulose-5-phosphate synthase